MATITKPQKSKTVTGTNDVDEILLNEYQLYSDKKNTVPNNNSATSGLTVDAKVGNDVIVGSKYSDSINGGSGDDTITGGLGNDTITGGSGRNRIIHNAGDGNDKINLTKGENFTLELNGLSLDDLKYQYTNKGKDLKISYSKDGQNGSITLVNFAKSNVTNNADAKKKTPDTSSVEMVLGSDTINLRNYLYKINVTSNFTGGWLNEYIDASSVDGKLTKTVKVGKKKVVQEKVSTDSGLTLKGGAGDDTILATMYSDNITGGSGTNTIIIKNEVFGNDIVNLTKGENLILDFSAYGFKGLSDIKTTLIGNDLKIAVLDNGTLTLKNYTKSNIASLSFDLGSDVVEKFNNFNELFSSTNLAYNASNLSKTGSITTTNYNDVIDVSGLEKAYNVKNNTGVTINSGKGKDTIIGTAFNDKITAGADDDTINAGAGNNEIYFYKGDGNDIVENGNGVDTLVFAKNTKLEYSYAAYDLVIKYSDNDTITLKDYFKGHSVKYIQIGTQKTLLNPDKPQPNEYDDGEYHIIESTALDDIIIGTDGKDKIYSTEGDNVITVGKDDDILYGGVGNSTFVFSTGDGNDTIIAGSGEDTIVFENEVSPTFIHDLSNDDLVINYGENDNITLKDYYKGHSVTKIGEQDISGLLKNNVNEIYTLTDNGEKTEIVSNGGVDTLNFPTADLTYEHDDSNKNLVIRFGTSSLTLKNYFKGEHSVSKIGNEDIATLIDNNLNETFNCRYYDYGDGTHYYIEIESNGGTDTVVYSGKIKNGLLYNPVYGIGQGFLEHDMSNDNLLINFEDNFTVVLKGYFSEDGHSVKYIKNTPITDYFCYLTNVYNVTYNEKPFEMTSGEICEAIKFDYYGGLTFSQNMSNNDLTICYDERDCVILKNYSSSHSTKEIIYGMDKYTIQQAIAEFGINKIYEVDASVDTVELKNGSFDNLVFSRDGYDVVISFKDNLDEKIILKEMISSYGHNVKYIKINGETRVLEEVITMNIQGTDNNDRIYGTRLNDIITPNKGKDTIYGSAGNDTYVFKRGDGQDTISSGSGNDVIKFNEKETIEFSKSLENNNLVINYGYSDSITLQDYYSTDHSVKTIINGNETISIEGTPEKCGMTIYGTSSADTIYGTDADDVIIAGYGDDVIDGKGGNDTYVFYYGQGQDTIISGDGEDKIKFGSKEDISYGHDLSNDDLLINYGSGSIALKDYFLHNDHSVKTIQNGNNTIVLSPELLNSSGMSISGSNEDETIYGTNGNDTIKQSGGNDIIYLNGGNDYVYSYRGEDTLVLKGTSWDNLTFERYSDNGKDNYSELLIKYSDKDSVLLHWFFPEDNHKNSVKYIQIGDEKKTLEELVQTVEIRKIYDTIKCSRFNEQLYFDNSSCNSSIYSGSGEGEIFIDTTSFDDITYTKDISGYDLTINYGNGKKIYLKNYFESEHSVKYITVKGEKRLISSELSSFVLTGTDYGDKIYGTTLVDTIVPNKGTDYIYLNSNDNKIIFKVGDGTNYIYSGSGEDEIVINGVDFENISYSKKNNDDNLYITYGDGDKIVLSQFFADKEHSVKYITANNEKRNLLDQILPVKIEGTSGYDTLRGTKYSDIILPGAGNDTIYLKGTGNQIVFYPGDRQDAIYSGDGEDTVVIKNVNLSKISHSKSGNDLILAYGSGAYDRITLDNYYSTGHSVKYLQAEDRTISIERFISSYLSDGRLYYVDNIEDNEIIIIDGASDVTLAKDSDSNNLQIIDNNNTRIFVRNYFSQEPLVKKIEVDNAKYNIEDLLVEKGLNIKGVNSDLDIQGTEYNDVINVVNDGGNNITVNAGEGNNTIIKEGRGTLTVENGGGTDTVWIKDGTKLHGYNRFTSFYAQGDDLIFRYNIFGVSATYDDIVVLKDYFKNDSHSVQYLKVDDLAPASFDSVFNQLDIRGTDGDDVIDTTVYDFSNCSVKFSGKVYGGDGNDTIYGGVGRYIYGGNGDDIIHGSDSKEWIYGGNGDDIIFTGNGDDYVDCGTGNGIVNCGSGDYTIHAEETGRMIINCEQGKAKIYTGKDFSTLCLGSGSTVTCGSGFIEVTKSSGNNTFVMKKTSGKLSITDVVSATFEFDKDEIVKIDGLLRTIYYNNGQNEIRLGKINLSEDEMIANLENVTIKIGDNSYSYYELEGHTRVGTIGDDEIHCGNGTDIVNAREGNDVIYTSNWNTIDAGKGNDTIYGNGYNTYIFRNGDGKDTIIGDSPSVIEFKEEQDLVYEATMDKLVIKYNNSQDSITLKNFDNIENILNYKIINGENEFYLKDVNIGKVIKKTLQNQYPVSIIEGSLGADTITCTADPQYGYVTYEVHSGAGDDTININGGCCKVYAGSGDDIIKNKGVDSQHLSYVDIYAGDGNNTVYGANFSTNYLYLFSNTTNENTTFVSAKPVSTYSSGITVIGNYLNRIYIRKNAEDILIWKANNNIYIEDGKGNSAVITNIDWSTEYVYKDKDSEFQFTKIFALDDFEYDIFNLPTSKEDAIAYANSINNVQLTSLSSIETYSLDIDQLQQSTAAWNSDGASGMQILSDNFDADENANILAASGVVQDNPNFV